MNSVGYLGDLLSFTYETSKVHQKRGRIDLNGQFSQLTQIASNCEYKAKCIAAILILRNDFVSVTGEVFFIMHAILLRDEECVMHHVDSIKMYPEIL